MPFSDIFKKRLLYVRRNLTKKQAGYTRQDETFPRYRKFLKLKNYFFDKTLLLDNFYYSDSFLSAKHPTFDWISTWDSFNDSYFSFIRKKKWKKYQKLSFPTYLDVYAPKSIWKNRDVRPFTTTLLHELKNHSSVDFFRKWENFRYNFQGNKTLKAYQDAKIEGNSKFYFLEHNFTNYSFFQDKKLFFWNSYKGARSFSFKKQIKRDFIGDYRPLRKRNINIGFDFKIWKRFSRKSAISYFGNRQIHEIRKFSRGHQKRPFSYGFAGYRMSLESYAGYYASEFIYKLKLAPTYESAKNAVTSGAVFVNGKVFNNHTKQIPVFSTIHYKGDWVRNYLVNLLSESDRNFLPYPRRTSYKNSSNFLGRGWPPSYIEMSFKLQEAVILRKSFRYEQPKPYVIHKSNPFSFLRAWSDRETPGVI